MSPYTLRSRAPPGEVVGIILVEVQSSRCNVDLLALEAVLLDLLDCWVAGGLGISTPRLSQGLVLRSTEAERHLLRYCTCSFHASRPFVAALEAGNVDKQWIKRVGPKCLISEQFRLSGMF